MNSLRVIKASGIAVMLLGSIHLAATPFVFCLFNHTGKPDIGSLYMFVMVGVAVLFTGWLQVFLTGKLNDDQGYEKVLTLSVVFIAILGIGATASLTKNPFAYIILLVAIVEAVALRACLKKNDRE